MFPLWDVAIAPVLDGANAKRVVEIGALRGETTVRMLEHLGPGAELHVIDPAPDFDPTEHERQFAGRYFFHRAASIDVLADIGPVDAALIDGDHNWYTVHHELRLLAETTRGHGAPLPVIVMHDVLWPYGRRDLYYEPDRIPEEFRQPYSQAGIKPGRKRLNPRSGLNPTMNNADLEGGPRNGVMTALDDFVAGYDGRLKVLVLPIYFGLAIVVDEERLEREPALAEALERLESSEGRLELLELSETIRLRAMVFQHDDHFQRSKHLDRVRARLLQVTKSSLLNEHYLENEIRMAHLSDALTSGKRPAPDVLRDPVRSDQQGFRALRQHRLGAAGPNDESASSFLPYAPMGAHQLDHLESCLDAVRDEKIPGDLVECGTGRGGGAIFLRAYLDCHAVQDRDVWVADAFRSSAAPLPAPLLPDSGVAGFRADLNMVRDGFQRFDLLDDHVHFLPGPMADTLSTAPVEEIAVLRIGRAAGDETRAALEALYDRVAPGGFVIIDAAAATEARTQTEEFRTDRGISARMERIDASAVVWRRSASDGAAAKGDAAGSPKPRAPIAPSLPADPLDLTVVVVLYNMRREAERTLHALSRAYQEGIDDVTYEVLVVENGSDAAGSVDAAFVERFGPEFRYIDLGADATPSPVAALNRGIALGRGRAFALMIDGAHVVTPGVLRFGLAGLETYAPSIVATQQWYVGPGQQGDAMDNGYDQAFEDRLFKRIEWPSAGYRLFEIGHFVGDRDWFDGVWESNCMFVPRSILRQVGSFDESFAVAGGGYANLEFYERLGSAPDVTVCSIIGEGSFHQTHGGTTTNQPDPDARRSRVFGYSQEYASLRGRPFRGPGKPIHYVGRIMTSAGRRSKPRRMSTRVFADAAAGAGDGLPDSPTPVPDELKWSFTEAVWRNLAWERTTWLGRRIDTAPTDLLAYQEILAGVRPDWVLETGTGDGGRALFLACMCELVGHGEVISVDSTAAADRPQHPRLRYLTGTPSADATATEVREIIGDSTAVVVLGSLAGREETVRQFERYADLVPTGSYVVVTDTIVNGHPVWPAFGVGPAEAVKQILTKHGEFVQDPDMEKYALTFNPGGFLRRVR